MNKKHIYLSIFLVVQVLFIQLIKQFPDWIETYYSQKLYVNLSLIQRFLLGWIPFSIGDVLGILLLIVIFKEVYKLIKNSFKNLKASILKLIACLSLIHFYFYLFWGLNYFRQPLAKSLNFEQSKYTDEQLETTSKKVLDKLNNYHIKITKNDTVNVSVPYSSNKIYKIAINGYSNLSSIYPQFNYNFSSVKSSVVSLFQSYNGTSGYLNPWTGEAQVNYMIPKTGMPATTCHEIAHQLGWAAENEANFIGFLASIYNTDDYFKYSGYRMAFRYCYRELSKRNSKSAKKIWNLLNKGVKKDFRNTYKHWQQFENPIEPFIKKGYNSYLKANNQAKGIDSYNYVVDLLISYYETKN